MHIYHGTQPLPSQELLLFTF